MRNFFRWVSDKWYRAFGWYLLCFCIGLSISTYIHAEEIKIDSSPAAVEAAYQAVREGDVQHVVSLKDTAEAMLVKLINAATATGEFIADQIPQVIKELVIYHTALYATTVLFGVLVIGFCWWLLLYTIRKDKAAHIAKRNDPYTEYSGEWWFTLFIIIPGGAAGIMLLCSIGALLKITLAPRVWLIEYAASLVK